MNKFFIIFFIISPLKAKNLEKAFRQLSAINAPFSLAYCTGGYVYQACRRKIGEFKAQLEADPKKFLVNLARKGTILGIDVIDTIPSVVKPSQVGLNPGTSVLDLINAYDDILGFTTYNDSDVGTKNTGLIDYYVRKLKSDASLSDQAFDFYQLVGQLDQSRKNGKNIPSGNDIFTTTNDFKGFRGLKWKPGWLWKLALRFTNGNAQRALMLIGVCGHDDVANKFRLSENRVDQYRRNNPVLNNYEEEKKRLEMKKKLPQLSNDQIRKLQLLQSEVENVSLLDDEFDLGNAISRINESGTDKITLEDYAAYEHFVKTDRELSRHESKANEVQEKINSFTGGTLIDCPQEDSLFYTPQALGANLDISKEFKQDLAKSLKGGGSQGGHDLLIDNGESVLPSAKGYHFLNAAAVTCDVIGRGHSPEVAAQIQGLLAWFYRLQRFLTETCQESDQETEDAVSLLKDNPKLLLDTLTTSPDKFIRKYDIAWASSPKNAPKDWSPSRIARAKRKARVILLDFLWTTEQHRKGAEFAKNNCI